MALAAKHGDKEQEKGRVERTTVKRYWPGRAPSWAEGQQQQQQPAGEEAPAQQVQRTAITAPVVVKKVADPRLARLAQRQVDREEAIEEHRQIRAAEVVVRRRAAAADEAGGSEDSSDEAEEEEEEQQAREEVDEEELQRRRDALRERLRQQQEQQLLAAPADDEDEGSSEYTTDDGSDDDDDRAAKLVKPVFVRKAERDTIAEREAAEAAEEAAEELRRQRLEERAQESRALLVQAIAADEAERRAAAAPVALKVAEELDTGDEAEPDAIEAWQRREAARIRRDATEREAAEAAAAEREKLRAMTEEERLAYLAAQPKEGGGKPEKAKWRFMQKYWHRGAFFQAEADDARGTAGPDAIYARDFSAPTGEDKFDKEALPAVMQVRNFGRAGRTKWKHLLAEDTSTARREDDWYRRDERLAGAVSGGYARDTTALLPASASFGAPGGAKRGGASLSEGFTKPKRFKT
ncbi:MFAP1 [Scenedesmus sp. PABB004]|nr:MFAP1 [Scenedesmus sp. PABB004]